MSDKTSQFGHLIREAMSAHEHGDRLTAQTKIRQAIQLDPDNEQAWLWAAAVSDTPAERIYCYERVLELDPYNAMAYESLTILQGSGITKAQPPAQNQVGQTIPLNNNYQAQATASPLANPQPSNQTPIYLAPSQRAPDLLDDIILEKMKNHYRAPDIVRYLSEVQGVDWYEAERRVKILWDQHIATIHTGTVVRKTFFGLGVIIVTIIFLLGATFSKRFYHYTTSINEFGRFYREYSPKLSYYIVLAIGILVILISIIQIIVMWWNIHRDQQQAWHKSSSPH